MNKKYHPDVGQIGIISLCMGLGLGGLSIYGLEL